MPALGLVLLERFFFDLLIRMVSSLLAFYAEEKKEKGPLVHHRTEEGRSPVG